ncbi:CEP192 [Acanthosepion pharaonis]|uniref:CEP192 n=1 Tax=Acanthosepion pharaonis TaxID=158019 RepID=A0A812CGL3_ACAPH|nr:CEP192 [Sepia pharaonis]
MCSSLSLYLLFATSSYTNRCHLIGCGGLLVTAMFSNSVAEQDLQDNPFDDGVLCNSPTPLATSTAKKKLNTLPCTSHTQAAVAAANNHLTDRISQMASADQSTDSVFKHPGVFLPGGTSVRQTTGKRQSEACQQQKSSRAENLPPQTANAVTKLDTSVMSEQSLVSNASSMGLLPDYLLNGEPEEMLVPQEPYSVTESLEQSRSSDISIEQARRYPAEESYNKRNLSGSHFASAHAFLQLQGMKTGTGANLSPPKIILGAEEICELDKDFGSEREDTIVLESPVAESPLNTPGSTTPVRMALNDVVTNATRLIDAQGNKHLEELSYCSSLGLSHDDNQSFSLEKMLRGNKPEEKPWTEELSQTSEYGIGWGKSQTFSCEPFAEDKPVESTKLYEDDPFDNDLAYRTEFDADISNIQNDSLSGEFIPFESAAAKLDADEAEFFGENANPDFSLFNKSHAGAELPILEELEEEEDDDDDGPEDIKPVNNDGEDDQPAETLPPPVLTQSLISNSLISNILDMASMSMSNDEIASKFVAQLDKRQRSRSGTKRDIPSLKSNMQTPITFQPDASQSIVSQDNFQSRVPSNISMPSSANMVNNGSIMSASCSTHTLTNQKSGVEEELESSVQMGAQNQSYHSPVATKNNHSSSPDGMKFRTPRESMYVPRALAKHRNITDESKFNCHLRFDDADITKPVIKEGPNRKSTAVTRPQTKTEEVVSHGLQKMPRVSLKSAQDNARLSAASQSHVNHQNGKDCKELGTENKSLADLSAVLSARMNITDARKIQAILMNRHQEGNEVDVTCQWQTMMEDPLGQTQVNFNVFTSSLLEDENPAANVENFLDSADFAALKRKPKFEIDRVVNIPDCTIGISEKACVTVRNLVDCWLECHLDMLHLFVNGREVNIRTYNPFRMKQKLVLAPKETQKLEVVFFPKDPGSYMAEVRMSSGSQTASPHQKTHEDDHVTCYMKLNSYADLPSIHFSPKELDFGQQSWGSTGCLPITVANKNKAKIPLRFVILSKSSDIFRWGHKTLPDAPGYESNYTVVSDNIACLTLPGAQAGCALDMTSLDIICDLVKKCALKDPKQATSLIGVVEIQLDVPSAHAPLGIIQLVVTAGIAKLHVSNGVDLIVMETSVNKAANRTVTLRNAGTLDLHVALDISRHEQVFTLDSGYLKIPVGERADVNVAFHPQDESVKSYNAEMMMFMEPNGPVFGIPVQGKILAVSHSHSRQHKWLLADQSHINFGGVPLGQSNPTRCSVLNGKINIKSSDDSTRFVIPLTGYGGLSEVFLAEPLSGILKITQADATAASSQTANFTLRNSGIRDAFFCVQIYEDSDKSVLAKKQAFAIDPPNGILKSLEKITVTLLCNQMAMSSLPVHIAIYHGEEEARQQLKRALKKFPNQRSKWKWSDWFDTVFTNEDYTQSYDQTLSQRSDINVFFDHLSTLELTVEISKKTHKNEKWSYKNPKVDWDSTVRESQIIQRPTAKPLKEMVKKDSKLQKHFPNIETDKENVQSGRVGSGSQMSSVADKTGGIYSLPGEGVPSELQKIWRLVPEKLIFISKDPQIFSIINFGQESLK